MMPSNPPLVIVGAGPTGLGALQRAVEHAQPAVLYEHSRCPGGLARTIRDDHGFRWEIGGHVTFSHYPRFDRLLDELLGDRFGFRDRESWVVYEGLRVPYPFQQNLRYLDPARRDECLDGLDEAQQRTPPERAFAQARSFADVIENVFGRGIARVFMTPYNRKVWRCEPGDMSKTWLGERVALVDARRARDNVRLARDDFGWGPNNRFRFPIEGTGAIYDALAAKHANHIRYGRKLRRIDPVRRIAAFSDGDRPDGPCETVPFEALLSTIPLDVLCSRIVQDCPTSVRDAAQGLRRTSGTIVGIGIRRPVPSSSSWLYFPEDNQAFYRVTYLSNYSPRMAPKGCYSLLCEISRAAGAPHALDPVQDVLRGLESVGMFGTSETGTRDDIVTTWVHHLDHSYPVPTLDRDERLAVVLPWLEAHGIYSRGRFGLWKYEVSNTDHSVMQGMEWVDRVVDGTPEQTIGVRYDFDGIAHVRSSTAGSGEPRITDRAADE